MIVSSQPERAASRKPSFWRTVFDIVVDARHLHSEAVRRYGGGDSVYLHAIPGGDPFDPNCRGRN